LPRVQLVTPDDGHRRYPKHVEFYDKINFGYLMHLVDCFIRNQEKSFVLTMFALENVVMLMSPVEENYANQHVIKGVCPTKTERNRAERQK
jgi:hypothetical protein